MGTLDDREMQRFIYDALAPHIPAASTTTIAGIRKPKRKVKFDYPENFDKLSEKEQKEIQARMDRRDRLEKPSPPSISFPAVFEYVKLEH